MTTPEPIASQALAAEVSKKVRERGLVVWLDADNHYGAFTDALATGALGFSYPVVAFRGSYLELMLALEPYGNDTQPDYLLVHLPGLNQESLRETPVYELAAAGTRFERNLGSLVRDAGVGLATPADIEAFVKAPGLTLAAADTWLATRTAEPREGLALLLESLGLEDAVMALLNLDRRFDAYFSEDAEPLLSFLEKGLGLDEAWRRFRFGDNAPSLRKDAAAALVASWLMAIEFVHDLKEAPVTPALQALSSLGAFAKPARKLVARFRRELPDVYEELENGLQMLFAAERTSHHADALGSIDTFRFEELTIRAKALEALREGAWDRAHAYAVDRTPESSFWVQRSPALQRVWEMVRLATEAGRGFARTRDALATCRSLEEATTRYADTLAEVDRAHRVFEQRAHASIAPDLEDYDALLDARAAVRKDHRAWTDGINRGFHALCREHGPLPDRSLRQRAVYEDVVQRSFEGGVRTAFFMVDALRFEMAQAFAVRLRAEKYQVHLAPRLAELPTDTSVGMNALAPVESAGRLTAVVKNGAVAGFRRKDFAVCDPAARVKAIGARSLGEAPVDLELEAFQDMSLTQLKRRLAGKTSLVVVRSRELDTAGEHNLHLGTFDQTLALLGTAISLLLQAGIERVVIASDHGFLLQDSTTKNVPFGVSKRVPERRHALLDQPSGMADVLEVRLSKLDYDVEQDLYLVLAADTSLWKTRDDVAPFVHGGNSLQERVIPVLQVERPVARGRTTSRYEVVARPEASHLGRQRLRVAVRLQNRETATLGFLAPKQVTLALRVHNRPDLALTLLGAEPPAELAAGRILVQPNRGEALVEFEMLGAFDEKVRVEVFHPDAIEEVVPKMVEGFFDVGRTRRAPRPSERPPASAESSAPVAAPAAAPERAAPPVVVPPSASWMEMVTDEGYRKVLQIIEQRRSINEEELQTVLGTPMRVRAFARNFDRLVLLLPFGVAVVTVNGMKAYARKD